MNPSETTIDNEDNKTKNEILEQLAGMPFGPHDVLGRQKYENGIEKLAFVAVQLNHFMHKSLSSFACNFAIGCLHGCLFCYVSAAQHSGNPKDPSKAGGPLNQEIKKYGIDDPDAEWGKYLLVRPFDENHFLKSVQKAEAIKHDAIDAKGDLILKPDGNRAVMVCSTTDPFQVIKDEDPIRQKLLNQHFREMVVKTFEIIHEHSTLNVRILTRSCPPPEVWPVLKKLGNRVLFGVSLPTVNDSLRMLYEPDAPGMPARLRTLAKAVEQGIPVYVAMAPTYPECDEADIRATLKAIKAFNPVTIFHEPINVRAKNIQRIEAHAASIGEKVMGSMLANREAWRAYAICQLQLVEKVAKEEGLIDQLHLWPDKDLGCEQKFVEMREWKHNQAVGAADADPGAKKLRAAASREMFCSEFKPWLDGWWSRISEWPGKEGQNSNDHRLARVDFTAP